MADPKKVKRTVRIRGFSYFENDTDPLSGDTIRVERTATRGDTIEVEEPQAERGDRLGAFGDPAARDGEEAVAPVSGSDLSLAGDDELVAFVESANASDVVDAAGNDPALARRLLDAEQTAHGQDARKTVVEPLTALAASDE